MGNCVTSVENTRAAILHSPVVRRPFRAPGRSTRAVREYQLGLYRDLISRGPDDPEAAAILPQLLGQTAADLRGQQTAAAALPPPTGEPAAQDEDANADEGDDENDLHSEGAVDDGPVEVEAAEAAAEPLPIGSVRDGAIPEASIRSDIGGSVELPTSVRLPDTDEYAGTPPPEDAENPLAAPGAHDVDIESRSPEDSKRNSVAMDESSKRNSLATPPPTSPRALEIR